MLADIQGADHNLTDPEIASLTGVYNDEEQLLFCAGNCSQEAFATFLRHMSVMHFAICWGLHLSMFE